MHGLANGLKVALISSEYPPSRVGGVSAVCHDLACSLSKKGVNTTVFCGSTDLSRKPNELPVERVTDYLTVIRMPILRFPPRHFWFPVQNLNLLLNSLKEFDIIHNVDTRSDGVLASFRKKSRKPWITHVHGCGHCESRVFVHSPVSSWSLGEFVYFVLEYPLNEYLVTKSLRRSDHLVVCSTARVIEMARRNPEVDITKVSVIYNGIDLDKDRYKTTEEENECSILYWGRLFYNKGILQLVKAMPLIKRNFPNVQLDVCGKGPLEANLKAIARKLGVESSISFHGYVTDEFLVKKINTASVIALPSLYEGQPVAALEAMAHKKPVVMYDYLFAREYIKDWHNGLLAKGDDVADLAERICVALSDKKLRAKLGFNAYEWIAQNHNWKTLVNRYITLYKDLTQKMQVA